MLTDITEDIEPLDYQYQETRNNVCLSTIPSLARSIGSGTCVIPNKYLLNDWLNTWCLALSWVLYMHNL